MKNSIPGLRLDTLAIALMMALWPVGLLGQSQTMDVHRSSLKVKVYKSGMFSALAHDHVIEAPMEEGTIDSSGSPAVRFRVDARKLRVLDPELSDDKRAEIQRTMSGPMVLDSEHFPEISYQSKSIEKTGDASWRVRGNLNLHAHEMPVEVLVSLQNGHYRGSVQIKQSDFGIVPIRIAGGTIKVKDQVKIEFDIVAAP